MIAQAKVLVAGGSGLDIKAERIKVSGVRAGSVVVDWYLIKSTNAAAAAVEAKVLL